MMKQFFLFGQSNMAGADAVPDHPWQALASDEKSKLYCCLNIKEQPTNISPAPLAPILNAGVFIHGPEIGFARTLQDRMPDNYLFVKTTGNIPPGEKEFLWAIDKSYMRNALSFFETVCIFENVVACPTAILMAQGIDEALSERRLADYKTNLFTLIYALRAHFGNQSLPFLIGQSVKSPYAVPECMALVRECQRIASVELPNVSMVSIDDLAPYVRGHHLTSNSQLEFGHRFARAFLNLGRGWFKPIDRRQPFAFSSGRQSLERIPETKVKQLPSIAAQARPPSS